MKLKVGMKVRYIKHPKYMQDNWEQWFTIGKIYTINLVWKNSKVVMMKDGLCCHINQLKPITTDTNSKIMLKERKRV